MVHFLKLVENTAEQFMKTGVYRSQKAMKVCIKPEIQIYILTAYFWSLPYITEDTKPVKVYSSLASDYVYILFFHTCVIQLFHFKSWLSLLLKICFSLEKV